MKNNTKIGIAVVGGFIGGVLVDRIITERKSKQVVDKIDDFINNLDELAQEDEFQNEYKKEFNTSDTDAKTDEKKGDETDE